MMHSRRPAFIIAFILLAPLTLVVAACGSPPRATPAPGTATITAGAPRSPLSGTPTPFPVVTAKVVGSTQPDTITALAAHGDTVWLAVDDAILASMDDGAHWRQVSTITNGAGSLSFTSATDGWAGTPTGLLRTADGGTTWSPMPVASDDAIPRVRFVDAEHGWIDQRDTGLERTTDGGASWQPIASPCPIASHHGGFAFIDANQGWLMCDGEGAGGEVAKDLYETSDGGASWRDFSYWHWGGDMTPSPYQPPAGGGTNDMFFLDAQHGWVSEYRAGIVATDDGGRTWHATGFSPEDPEASSAIFTSATHGYALNYNGVSTTTDGGATWGVVYALPQLAPRSPARILKSVSIGGRTVAWSTLLPGFEVWAQAMHDGDLWIIAAPCTEEMLPPGKGDPQNRTYENCGHLMLLRSKNDGRAWEQYALPGIDLQDVFVAAGGALRVDAGRTVFEASDDGRTWTRVAPILLPSAPPATVEPGP